MFNPIEKSIQRKGRRVLAKEAKIELWIWSSKPSGGYPSTGAGLPVPVPGVTRLCASSNESYP